MQMSLTLQLTLVAIFCNTGLIENAFLLRLHGCDVWSLSYSFCLSYDRYIYRFMKQEELCAFYREAFVALVTPIRDG